MSWPAQHRWKLGYAVLIAMLELALLVGPGLLR